MRWPHLSDVLSFPELRNPFDLADRAHVSEPPSHVTPKYRPGRPGGPPYDYEGDDGAP